MARPLPRLLTGMVVLAVLFGLNLIYGNLLNSVQDMLVLCGIYVVLAVSLNIVNGFTGQFSIGHAGFMAVGAYVGAALTYPIWIVAKKSIASSHHGWSDAQVLHAFAISHWWLLPAAMLLGCAVAALFGWA